MDLKSELSKNIKTEYDRLIKIIKEVSKTNNYNEINIRNLIAYQIGWGTLLLGWYTTGLKGEMPEMPGDGFAKWDYKKIAEHFYKKYHLKSLDDQLKAFSVTVKKIITFVEKEDANGNLYKIGAWKWCTLKSGKKWPLSKWVQVNTVAPYKKAQSLIKKESFVKKTMFLVCLFISFIHVSTSKAGQSFSSESEGSIHVAILRSALDGNPFCNLCPITEPFKKVYIEGLAHLTIRPDNVESYVVVRAEDIESIGVSLERDMLKIENNSLNETNVRYSCEVGVQDLSEIILSGDVCCLIKPNPCDNSELTLDHELTIENYPIDNETRAITLCRARLGNCKRPEFGPLFTKIRFEPLDQHHPMVIESLDLKTTRVDS